MSLQISREFYVVIEFSLIKSVNRKTNDLEIGRFFTLDIIIKYIRLRFVIELLIFISS